MGAEALFSGDDRPARGVARHSLDRCADGPVAVARKLVILHSIDPSTPYLSCAVRIDDFATTDLDAALYEERTLRGRIHRVQEGRVESRSADRVARPHIGHPRFRTPLERDLVGR